MTTVDDILQLIDPSDRLRIVKDGKDLFVGYVGVYKLDSEKQLQDTFGSCEVKRFRAVPELRTRTGRKTACRWSLITTGHKGQPTDIQ